MKVTISEVDGTTRVEVDPGGLPPGPGPLDILVRAGWTVSYDPHNPDGPYQAESPTGKNKCFAKDPDRLIALARDPL